jgi:hypothetical protein
MELLDSRVNAAELDRDCKIMELLGALMWQDEKVEL